MVQGAFSKIWRIITVRLISKPLSPKFHGSVWCQRRLRHLRSQPTATIRIQITEYQWNSDPLDDPFAVSLDLLSPAN